VVRVPGPGPTTNTSDRQSGSPGHRPITLTFGARPSRRCVSMKLELGAHMPGSSSRAEKPQVDGQAFRGPVEHGPSAPAAVIRVRASVFVRNGSRSIFGLSLGQPRPAGPGHLGQVEIAIVGPSPRLSRFLRGTFFGPRTFHSGRRLDQTRLAATPRPMGAPQKRRRISPAQRPWLR